MNVKIVGKELKATESIKDYVAKKLERIEKYFEEEDLDILVTIKTEKNIQIAEMHVTTKDNSYRAVTEHSDLYASIDKDIDILEGQIRKAKTKKDKMNKEASIRQKEINQMASEKETSDEILKVTYYTIKPMSPEDAKLKLEEKPQAQFYTFINIDTGKVNVIYRLKDGMNFGLVEPEA